jgi:hypothetical protein
VLLVSRRWAVIVFDWNVDVPNVQCAVQHGGCFNLFESICWLACSSLAVLLRNGSP